MTGPDAPGRGGAHRPAGRGLALAAAAAALLALALYAPTLGHEFVDVDVGPYLTQNAQVQAGLGWRGVVWAFTSFHAANWHPLTWLSHMLDVELFGLEPAGHNAANALLFALSAALVVLVLARATGQLGPSAFVGLAFAAHPLHVESVAWIAERKDVLSGVLGLAALYAWLGWAQRGSRAAWWTALSLFALGLLAKPMLVTLPFVLLLFDVWPLARTQRGLRTLVLEKLPFLALALASSWVTVVAQRAGGAMQGLQNLPFGERAANALLSWVVYLRRAFWPDDLCFFHPFARGVHTAGDVAGAAALLVGLSVLAWWQRHRRPWIQVGWLGFLGMLVPVIGLVHVGSQSMADRYMHLPLLMLSVAVAWTAHELVRPRGLCIALAGAAIAALSLVTWRQVATWRDSESLARRALEVHPTNPVALNLLGHALGQHGDLQGALRHQGEALRIVPGDVEARTNRAVTLYQLGRFEEAEQDLREVLAARPRLVKAHETLGAVLITLGRLDEARLHLEEALRLGLVTDATWLNLGLLYDLLGDAPAARRAFERALGFARVNPNALIGLARIELDEGRPAAAAPLLERALALAPNSPQALHQSARLAAGTGDERQAAVLLRRAHALDPGWHFARLDLAWLLASARSDEVAAPDQALELVRPIAEAGGGPSAVALDTAALALARLGRFEEAEQIARVAAERAAEAGDPDYAARIEARRAQHAARRFERGAKR